MLILYCHPNCSTCKKAKKWLEKAGIAYEERDIRLQNPDADTLLALRQKSGLPLKRFFNTSGMQYRALALSEKLPEMSEEEQLCLLVSDGMLVKRPLLVSDSMVLVGFREEAWAKALGQ